MAKDKEPICGVVRPIASLGDYSAQHWIDVAAILDEAIIAAGFQPRLVSDADGIGVIQARIVQNLYADPIVVCDVSGKNPNVMFELGIRLAFDKPVVVIKDDLTSYSFDTSPIEHLSYPSTLHYGSIIDFKEKLSLKIKATHDNTGKPHAKSFLQHFGPIKVAELGKEIVPGYEILRDEIISLKRMIRSQNPVEMAYAENLSRNRSISSSNYHTYSFSLGDVPVDSLSELAHKINRITPATEVSITAGKDGGFTLEISPDKSRGFSDRVLAEIEDLISAFRKRSLTAAKL